MNPPTGMILCRNCHIQYLCDNMRADERGQYLALSGLKEYDADAAARYFMNLPGYKFTFVTAEGLPAAAGGYHEVAPGVWQSWMIGTEDGWKSCWKSLTKGSRWLMDWLFDNGARRLQTTALANRELAIKWYLHGLKMRQCGVMHAFGVNGEAVAMFERIHPELESA